MSVLDLHCHHREILKMKIIKTKLRCGDNFMSSMVHIIPGTAGDYISNLFPKTISEAHTLGLGSIRD